MSAVTSNVNTKIASFYSDKTVDRGSGHPLSEAQFNELKRLVGEFVGTMGAYSSLGNQMAMGNLRVPPRARAFIEELEKNPNLTLADLIKAEKARGKQAENENTQGLKLLKKAQSEPNKEVAERLLADAVAHFDTAVRLNPDHLKAHANLACAYAQQIKLESPDVSSAAPYEHLQRALELAGPKGSPERQARIEKFRADADLEPIRGDVRFELVLASGVTPQLVSKLFEQPRSWYGQTSGDADHNFPSFNFKPNGDVTREVPRYNKDLSPADPLKVPGTYELKDGVVIIKLQDPSKGERIFKAEVTASGTLKFISPPQVGEFFPTAE